jgi:hypothetical protein
MNSTKAGHEYSGNQDYENKIWTMYEPIKNSRLPKKT